MTDRDFSDSLSSISLILMRILQNVGVNKRNRRKRKRMWTQLDQMRTFCFPYITNFADFNRFEYQTFGSQIEGATTPDLKSDVDTVVFDRNMVAVENVQDYIPGFINLLMVADENTYPGYFKLQYLNPCTREPMFTDDNNVKGRLTVDCNKFVVMEASKFFSENCTEIHGPAATLILDSGWSMDNIMGIRVKSWVKQAISWQRRPRRSNWITTEDFKYLVKKEAFLVPVGSVLSHERNLEWRISFTTVERELMWKLNSTQMACYILMKMIIKTFITPIIGDVLSSYHCKTVLFYLIDNTEGGFWRPRNVLVCLDLILKTIRSWVGVGICPNYLLPNENMFQGKVSGQVRKRLLNILGSLIEHNFKYLIQISFDGVGDALSKACIGTCSYPATHTDAKETTNTIYSMASMPDKSVVSVISPYEYLLKRCKSTTPQSLLARFIQGYESMGTLVQEGLCPLIGFLCSHIGVQLASQYLAAQDMSTVDMKTPYTYLHIGTVSDVSSGRLKLAGFYLRLGYASLAAEVLTAVEKDFNQYVSDVSVVDYRRIEDVTGQMIMSEDLTLDSMFKKYIAVSVVYLPSEINCILPPLNFEMFRSVGSNPDLRNPDEHFWYDFAIVDAKPYMYFLQHQTFSVLGMRKQGLVALKNLAQLAGQNRIRHIDTCLNLIAYCLRQEGMTDRALRYLRLSFNNKPQHNAAIWQICDIVNTIINDETLIYSRI